MSNVMRVAGVLFALVVVAGVAFLLSEDEPEPGGARAVDRAPVAPSVPEGAELVERAGDAEPLRSELVAADAAPPAVAPTDDAAAASDEEDDEDEQVAAIFTGRVVDGGGRGIPGASVALVPALTFTPDLAGDPIDDLARAETGPDGRFTLETTHDRVDPDEVPIASLRIHKLVATHPSFATHVHRCESYREGEPYDAGTLALEPGATVRGRATDESGRPLAGVRVAASPASDGSRGFLSMLDSGYVAAFGAQVTGDDGRFTVSGVPAGPGELTASREGMRLTVVEDLVFDPLVPLDVGEVVMRAGQSIAGTVTDERGNPIEGMRMSVSSFSRIVLGRLDEMPRREIGQEFRTAVETDEHGAFEIAGLAGGNYTVHGRLPGFEPVDRENVPAGSDRIALTASRLGGVLVLVTDALSGAPVDGAEIAAEEADDGQGGFRGMRLRRDDDERVEVLTGAAARAAAGSDGPPAGAYFVRSAGRAGTDVTVLADGYAMTTETAPPAWGDDVVTVEVALRPEVVLAGVVLDEDRRPIEGARVSLSEPPPPPEPQRPGERRIERSVSLGDGPSEAYLVRSDAEGRFRIANVTPGAWDLHAAASGFVDAEPRTLELDEGEQVTDLVVELGRAGSVVGLVLDPEGRPVEGVRVTARAVERRAASLEDQLADGFGALFGGDPGGRSGSGTTDADGRYRIVDLAPGAYDVSLRGRRGGMRIGGNAFFMLADDGAPPADETGAVRVEVTAGDEVRVDLVKPFGGTIRGRVIAAGAPVPDVQVDLRPAGAFLPFARESARTDRRGEFELLDVEAGEYELVVMVPGAGLEETAEVEVAPGETARQDLVLGGATIAGRVVDMVSGEGAGGVTVRVEPVVDEPEPSANFAFEIQTVNSRGPGGSGMSMTFGGQRPEAVTTGPDGRYEVLYLHPGEYSLVMEGAGYVRTEAGPFELGEGQRRDDVVVEVRPGGVLAGTVVSGETGERLDQVPVRLRRLDDGGPGGVTMENTRDGDFRFDGLETGEYLVEALGSGFRSAPLASETLLVEEGGTTTATLITEE